MIKTITINNLKTAGGNPAPDQFEIRNGSQVLFQSYNSRICIIDFNEDTITFGRDWDYSNTTMKYLKWFLEDNLNCTAGVKFTRDIIGAGVYTDVSRYGGRETEYKVIYDENL